MTDGPANMAVASEAPRASGREWSQGERAARRTPLR